MKFFSYFILLSVALSLSACSKLEDGNNFSLRSKRKRLIGEWVLEKYEVKGMDRTGDIQWTINLMKDNKMSHQFDTTATFEQGYSSFYMRLNDVNHGALGESNIWYYISNEKAFQPTSIDLEVIDSPTFEVYRLTRKEMVLKIPAQNTGYSKVSDDETFYFKRK